MKIKQKEKERCGFAIVANVFRKVDKVPLVDERCTREECDCWDERVEMCLPSSYYSSIAERLTEKYGGYLPPPEYLPPSISKDSGGYGATGSYAPSGFIRLDGIQGEQMKEKIAQWLSMSEKYGNFLVWDALGKSTQENYRIHADWFIDFITEEIEKVEKPRALRSQSELYSDGFNECRQKILSLFKGT